MSRGWGTFGGGSRSHDLWSLGGVTGIMGMESEAHLWYLKCTEFSSAMLCYY